MVGVCLLPLLLSFSTGWRVGPQPRVGIRKRSEARLSAASWIESSEGAANAVASDGDGSVRSERSDGSATAEQRSAALGAWELGLLPFSLTEALLPGETKQVHLFEARFLSLFESSAKNHNMLGQLLVTPGGNVAAVTSLIEVEESRRKDVGVWAQLKCVGRIKLVEVSGTDFDWVKAKVELVTDHAIAMRSTSDEGRADERADERADGIAAVRVEEGADEFADEIAFSIESAEQEVYSSNPTLPHPTPPYPTLPYPTLNHPEPPLTTLNHPPLANCCRL